MSARVSAAPHPHAVTEGELVGTDVALGVEEMCAEDPSLFIESDQLYSADGMFANSPVGGMNDKESTGNPLVDIARLDFQRR